MSLYSKIDVKNISDYTAIIVEPREHAALEFVLSNFLENLTDNWSIVILHSDKNKDYLNNVIQNIPNAAERIQKVKINVDNLHPSEYSDMFFHKEFYECIPTEMFLVFQTDSMILPENKDKILDFMEYDYVGSPWPLSNGDNPMEVGNGGLSLRRKCKMLELLSHLDEEYLKKKNIHRGKTYYIEDVFFCGKYHEGVELKKPSYEKSKEFASEADIGIDPFGIHACWKYSNAYNALIQKYPIISQLKDLQFIYTSFR
jgi:hypothetical protein